MSNVQKLIVNIRTCCFFVVIQFVCQPPCQRESRDEAVDGQILGDLVLVDDLQDQFPLRLVQPFDEFLMATRNLGLELPCRKFFVEVFVQCFQHFMHVLHLLLAKHNTTVRAIKLYLNEKQPIRDLT